MRRTIAAVSLIVVLAAAAVVGWRWFRESEELTIVGQFSVVNPEIVYAAGTPAANGGVSNGCSWLDLRAGAPVTIRTPDGDTIATGTITETFHWESEQNMLLSRANHGCGFSVLIQHVPQRDRYELWAGVAIGVGAFDRDALEPHTDDDGKRVYILPDLRIEL